jgi:hypothetical protein
VRSDTDAGLAPMPPLCVVSIEHQPKLRGGLGDSPQPSEGIPNSVAGSEANPLRDRSVLLLRARKLLLGTERFVALWTEECKQNFPRRGSQERGAMRVGCAERSYEPAS